MTTENITTGNITTGSTNTERLSGSIELSGHQYGKAENRVVRIYRDTPRHEIHDINVSTCLRGDFADAYLTGDQSKVLPTDTQKQTAYSYAKEKGLISIETYGLELARHFVDDIEPVSGARIEIEEYAWERAIVDGSEHDYTWIRKGQEVRTASITISDTGTWVIGGLKDLVILKSTGSEFSGFLEDPYTVLEPTDDRVMATTLVAQWRFVTTDVDWESVYAGIKHRSSSSSHRYIHSPCSRRSSTSARQSSRNSRSSRRFDCPHPTSIISNMHSAASEWRTTTRCSTLRIVRTA